MSLLPPPTAGSLYREASQRYASLAPAAAAASAAASRNPLLGMPKIAKKKKQQVPRNWKGQRVEAGAKKDVRVQRSACGCGFCSICTAEQRERAKQPLQGELGAGVGRRAEPQIKRQRRVVGRGDGACGCELMEAQIALEGHATARLQYCSACALARASAGQSARPAQSQSDSDRGVFAHIRGTEEMINPV